MTRVYAFMNRYQIDIKRVLMTLAAICSLLLVFFLRPGSGFWTAADLALQGGVNRHVPHVQAPPVSLTFSQSPRDAEFLRVGIFKEPLTPVGSTSSRDNRDLAQAIIAYDTAVKSTGDRDQVSPLTDFLSSHPKSAWRPALLVNLGLIYRETGHYSKALDTFKVAWSETGALKDKNGVVLGDLAIAQFTQLDAYLGRKEELSQLLQGVQNRQFHGTAAELISASRRGLDHMKEWPQLSFRCGPLALLRILLHTDKHPSSAAIQSLENDQSTPNGLSLPMVKAMSDKAGMHYQMAYRTPGAKVIFPAVVNWKTNHYAAVIGVDRSHYLVQDSTFGGDIRMTQQTLDEEASGYFLVPAGPLPAGWRPVAVAEGSKIWGRGDTGMNTDNGSTGPDTGTPVNPTHPSCPGPCTTWSVEAMSVSLLLHDRPLHYAPPIGPAINIDVDYSHRDIQQPGTFNYVNLGSKWTINWISYVTDDIGSSLKADLYVQGGGDEQYTMPGWSALTSYVSPFNQAVMTRTVDSLGQTTSFTRWLKDGSREVFAAPLGNKFFMTAKIDPQGNQVTITYDAQMRIAALTDAIGQVTTFSYENSDPLKITKITDPFGRSTKFTYTTAGQLESITDMIGITSSFDYDTGDFIDALTTPYGTTHFSYAETGDSRSLDAVDTLGRHSRVEFNQYAWPDWADPDGMPDGMNTYNYYINFRNTFIWTPEEYKAATASGGLDYTKAKIIHWLHTSDYSATSRVMESEKEPNESRVWYTYPGQSDPIAFGNSNTITAVGRLLDDGSSQVQRYEYNNSGNVTKSTDPVGRTIEYGYASNGIDLMRVTNTTGGTVQTLAEATYNAQHLPLTVKGPDGTTTTYEYNTAGQVTKVTDALGNSTSYTYDANHYLTQVQGPVGGATYTFTHDNVGRISSATDPAGMKVSYEYDDNDRPTKATFPDGTSAQFAYHLLDLVKTTDRLGQETNLTYDSERQLTKVSDPLAQVTQYGYDGTGNLTSIIDPNGHATKMDYDLEGRAVTKTYADNTKQTTTYENRTSRVKSTTDALGQQTAYAYNVDDTPDSITYTNAPKVTFTYDAAYKRPLFMQDGNGTTAYTYYPVGGLGGTRLQSETMPIAGATGGASDKITYGYDALGRVVSRDIGGVVQTTSYDALGRTTGVSNALDNFTYAYGDATARVSSVTSTHGPRLDLSYYTGNGDELLKQMKYTANGHTLSQFDYEFNANDNVTKFTESYLGQQFAALSPSSGIGGGLFDGHGFGQSLFASVNGNTLAMVQARDVMGVVLFSGALLSVFGFALLFFSRKGRAAFMIPQVLALTLLTSCGGGDSGGSGGGGSSSSSSSSSTPTPSAQVTAYSYDHADRLTSASVGTDLSLPATPQYAYEYDAASNITGLTANAPKKTIAYTSTNAISTGTYDANGSPTALDGATYAWDGANRLAKYVSGVNESDFVYDGQSRLVRIIDKMAGIVTGDHAYTWCGMQRCLERDNTQSGSPVSKQYFDQGELQGATGLYYVIDRLGSVRQLVDSSGTIQAQYEYDAYGKRTQVSGAKNSDFGFTGLFHHARSDLNLAVYRAYNLSYSCWLNRDPQGENGGLNLYAYVSGNPVNEIDPLGLELVSLSEGQTIVDVAKTWQGVPYFPNGGDKSSRDQADCSGSTWKIYGEAGFPYPYSPSDNFSRNPKFSPAPNNVPQVGDVGQWNGHVLIYDPNAGNGNNSWSARKPGVPYGPAHWQWWSGKGPVTWYRYNK